MDKLTKCIKWPNGVVLSETESPDEMADGERGYFITKEQLMNMVFKVHVSNYDKFDSEKFLKLYYGVE